MRNVAKYLFTFKFCSIGSYPCDHLTYESMEGNLHILEWAEHILE